MLSYRHAFHAGNFADVLKHVVLVRALQQLVAKPKPLRYVDTHAGTGRYQLDSVEALKNAEFRRGIGLLWDRGDLPSALQRYVALVREFNHGGALAAYPGSPWFAQAILRDSDRLDVCELHPKDSVALSAAFGGARNVHCHAADGFATSLSLVPPIERRALVLIDPSYELKQDYDGVVAHVKRLHRRFATGVYMVWYPIVGQRRARRMEQAWRNSGIRRIDLYQLDIVPASDGQGMTGAAVAMVNPPWGLADDVAAALRYFATLANSDGAARARIETLVRE